MKRIPILLLLAVVGCHRKTSTPETSAAEGSAPQSSAEMATKSSPDSAPHTIDRGDGWTVEVTQDGSGREARIGDEVVVAYDAHVKDAEETIASTRGWTTPCRFRLGGPETIPGLSRGLEGIRAGSKVRIEVPPALGYGATGCPAANVPADATLVFEVELLGVGG